MQDSVLQTAGLERPNIHPSSHIQITGAWLF